MLAAVKAAYEFPEDVDVPSMVAFARSLTFLSEQLSKYARVVSRVFPAVQDLLEELAELRIDNPADAIRALEGQPRAFFEALVQEDQVLLNNLEAAITADRAEERENQQMAFAEEYVKPLVELLGSREGVGEWLTPAKQQPQRQQPKRKVQSRKKGTASSSKSQKRKGRANRLGKAKSPPRRPRHRRKKAKKLDFTELEEAQEEEEQSSLGKGKEEDEEDSHQSHSQG